MRKYFIGLLIGMLLTVGTGVIASQNISILVDGEEVETDVPPQVIDGRTMVPIRFVADALDAEVDWDGENRTVLITSPEIDEAKLEEIRNETEEVEEEEPVAEPEEVVEEEPEPEPEAEEIIQFISIGESTSFAEWDYKATDVETHNVIDDERARGQYVVFIIEVTNNAKMDREVGRLFQAEDKEERVFSFDSRTSLNHHHAYRTDAWHLDDIGPSFTAVMPIAFDVPEDVETLYLYPRDLKGEDFKDTAVIEYELDN